jgi:hypothetical protein
MLTIIAASLLPEAALRGMVTAAAWSPFFVAFAIGQGFVGNANSWIAIGIGGVTAILFAAISLPLLNRSFSGGQLRLALICLKPVLMRLLLVLGAVLGSALLFDFTALSAVVVVMPVLVLVQFIRYPAQIKPIIEDTASSMRNIADDILIISMAMLIGYFATRTGAFTVLVTSFYDGVIPGWLALIMTPLGMMLASVVGVHPVISSTAFLAVFQWWPCRCASGIIDAGAFDWMGRGNDEFGCVTFGHYRCQSVSGAIA